MYFITCFTTTAEEIPNQRTFGFYDHFEECVSALHENRSDMHEFYYYQAVVERIKCGIHSRAEEMAWFAWNEEKAGLLRM